MTKVELREMIRECLREELSKTSLSEGIFDFGKKKAKPTRDASSVYSGMYVVLVTARSGRNAGNWTYTGIAPTSESRKAWAAAEDANRRNPDFQYKSVSYDEAIREVGREWNSVKDMSWHKFFESVDDAAGSNLEEGALAESTLTAEEKVDAWHAGTRRENYKAAGVPKLNTFLEIAKRKGYTDIVNIIEAELTRRGVAITSTTATSTASTTSAPVASAAPASEDEFYAEPTVVDTEPTEASSSIDDVAHFSDELVKEPEAPVLSDKDRDIIIGKAIDSLGKPAFYVRSFWRSAMGFIGSYSTTWYNSNYNEIKATRAQDKIRDLTYSSDKLIVLRSHYDGGSKNIDRYYSIEVPASTKYIVDTDKIRDMIYGSYYDSELDWRISTLAKTPANRKKFKQYLLDTVGMPVDQSEELTTYAFDKRVW